MDRIAAYYNENDPKAAAWLRELIKGGHIADGEVDDRSIEDVQPKDLEGFTQCHFFAGIGGWSYALRLAGWSDRDSVWTGSCPCQPFSQAGKQKGEEDERHLWPEFCRLIKECGPSVVFGEQVASPLGREWLSGVRSDLEALGYEVGAADLCAAGVSTPQVRQRLYWVADGQGIDFEGVKKSGNDFGQIQTAGADGCASTGRSRCAVRMASSCSRKRIIGCSDLGADAQSLCNHLASPGAIIRMGNTEGHDQRGAPIATMHRQGVEGGGPGCSVRLANSQSKRCGEAGQYCDRSTERAPDGSEVDRVGDNNEPGMAQRPFYKDGLRTIRNEGQASGPPGPWSDCRIVYCQDDKFRRIPIEPEFFPLADGVPGRVGLLRGYGNAIVPQVAAEFIGAFMDLYPENPVEKSCSSSVLSVSSVVKNGVKKGETP
jgi:DNA (cytosine-5)-methyltransferase 1